MTTDTMRRVRQKQRADRMLPAHSFQDQRLSRFLPAPKPRSRTSDERRDVRVVGIDPATAAGWAELFTRRMSVAAQTAAASLRPAFPPSWVEGLQRAAEVKTDQRVREANEIIAKARETMGDEAVEAVMDSVIQQAEIWQKSLEAEPPADAMPQECPYHVDQKCSADCWYRNPVKGAWLHDD